MNTWERIDRAGFYPRIVEAALRRALGGAEPLASVVQTDAAFDRGAMFRHLTLAAVGEDVLVQVHVDELEDGAASVGTSIHPLSRLGSVSLLEVVAEPEGGAPTTELTLSLDIGGLVRSEFEPAQCEDPRCEADHGYSGTSFPDDLNIRISAAADGEEALAEAEEFVAVLMERLRRVRG